MPRLWVNRDLPFPIPAEERGPMAQSLPHWRERLSHRLEGPLPGAIVSLYSCPRGQARSGQDWRDRAALQLWSERSTHGRRR